jgi:hypothetical protein
MPSPTEAALDAYMAAWAERDLDARTKLIEACWSDESRLVSKRSEIKGRAALEKAIGPLFANPQITGFRLIAREIGKTTFRIRTALELAGGKSVEFYDCGEVGPDGKIRVIFTFDGVLGG